ncbi:unnamed protein product, partial [Amoebophrya sp. A25]|eukprot:GSA25T00018467001.1
MDDELAAAERAQRLNERTKVFLMKKFVESADQDERKMRRAEEMFPDFVFDQTTDAH